VPHPHFSAASFLPTLIVWGAKRRTTKMMGETAAKGAAATPTNRKESMNDRFDELTKGLARSATRRQALRRDSAAAWPRWR